ncbi:C2 domain-containing protein 3 [Frankliniella fusca]|uniref:C2 domain-containing protein 3 n=1 Tax=Frankliniella fusca TaxID=407009 RepID=A0AAE1HPC7_9NEOP|nr:C2 domain-containing protein 3 [Frankliniella fusca]
MAEETTTVAGLSLPPKVVGKVNGHLVMKVDEVLWARKPPGEVSAVVLWWGGDEPTTFRPSDVAEGSMKRRNAGVIYEIRTSLDLFEKYLRKCGGLDIAIADKYGMPIGCVTVMDIWQMITTSPFQGYYPIVNNFGNRIGDLHVSFNLRMQSSIAHGNLTVLKAPNNQGFKTKDLKRLSPPRNKQSVCYSKSKEEKTKKNEKVLKDRQFSKRETPGSSSQCDSSTGNSDGDLIDLENEEVSEKRVSPTSNIISQILQHGTRLRNAMTASVMEDVDQFDLNNVPDVTALSSLTKAARSLKLGPDCCPPSPILQNTCQFKKEKSCDNTVPAAKKKVMDYLSGKPMSDLEEKEALAAIRNMTPTKDILENIPDTQTNFKQNISQLADLNAKESSEIVTNVTDYCENNDLSDENLCSFKIDKQLLSNINCIRITVVNLVLNSVGIRRTGSYPKKKRSPSQSTINLQPPGVTFFVEYKFPLAAGCRAWESDVRYCSKRFSENEVTFGDRTVHNFPTSWQTSKSEVSKWTALVSSLNFKVGARHLNQRVPIVLGLASPETAEPLIKSAHLRHNFDLSVIDSNRLPVAQLRVCLELGRDRIHFGGLFDPENNSLGVKSPELSSSNRGQPSQMNNKSRKSVTTVTRNISAKSCAVPKIPLNQATQADRLIKKLVHNANVALKSSQSSESSSLPSTGRSYFKQTNSHDFLENVQISSYMTSCPPNVSNQSFEQFIKHELALTFHQIIGTDFLPNLTCVKQYFYVTYKFPEWNALKKSKIDWCSCCTELSQNKDGLWLQPQNLIHSVVIPKKELFFNFMKQTFIKYEGKSGKACITFSLCIRCNEEKEQDFLVAEAHLPLSTIATLEEAYKEAARNKANFSSSSCSSIVLDLPLESLSMKRNQMKSEKNGCLRVKVDYRNTMVQPSLHKSYPPGSRGDSVFENIPYSDLEERSNAKETKCRKPSEGDLNLGRTPLCAPHWARTPDKTFSSLHTSCDGFKFEDVPYSNNGCNVPSRNVRATWEHALCNKTRESAHMHQSFPKNCQVQRSVIDVINDSKKCDPVSELKESPNLTFSQMESMNSQDAHLSSCYSNDHSLDNRNPSMENYWQTISNAEAETQTTPAVKQGQMSTRGTSPIPLLKSAEESKVKCESASVEAKPDQQDKAQQSFINTVHQECQTTPRDVKILRENVGTLAESQNKISVKADNFVLPRSSIDDVENIEVDSGTVLTTKPSPMDSGCQEMLKCEPNQFTSSVSHSSNDSYGAVKTFRAKLGVECAFHLQSTVGPVSGLHQSTQSFVFVSVNPCGVDGTISTSMCHNPLSVSPSVVNNGEPEWHWEKEVVLPLDLLTMTTKRLIFKIWESKSVFSECNEKDMESEKLIGFSSLDLTVLSAGLPLLCGWYNVIDFSGSCRGQIKLSVEPLEKISEIVDFALLPCDGSPLSSSINSMFVAHCAYPEFPSHITQFSDIHVQKVDRKATNQTMSNILGTYELVIKHREGVELPHSTSKSLHQDSQTSTSIPLQRKAGSTCLAQQIRVKCDSKPAHSVTDTVSTPCSGASELNSGIEVDQDPTILLREKLSELDKITKNMKERLLCQVETSDSHLRCSLTDNGQQFDFQISSEDAPHVDDNKENGTKCNACACSSIGKDISDDKKECCSASNDNSERKKNSDACGTSSDQSRPDSNIASQKQRKMWKRQEDLIDFGNLCISSENEEESVSQNEEEGEWLSESALQHVFNPYLFNDILNSMNSSRGVTVIELDDTETSEDSPATTSRENDDNLQTESGLPLSNHRHRNKRGDETFRKEVSESQRNKAYSNRQTNWTGLSAGDADSGVDVDLSSNFHSGLFFPASADHHEPFLPHHSGTRSARANTEREESSSCSSRYHHSTFPSSASATPTDSPLHTQQATVNSKGLLSGSTSSSHDLSAVETVKTYESLRKS